MPEQRLRRTREAYRPSPACSAEARERLAQQMAGWFEGQAIGVDLATGSDRTVVFQRPDAHLGAQREAE